MTQWNGKWNGALVATVLVLGMNSAAQAATYAGCFKNAPGKPSKVRPSSILKDQTPVCKSTETLGTWSDTADLRVSRAARLRSSREPFRPRPSG